MRRVGELPCRCDRLRVAAGQWSGPCDVNNDDGCDYVGAAIDQWDMTFIQTAPMATITCAMSVGGANAGSSSANGCAGYVLFYRVPTASEKYWP